MWPTTIPVPDTLDLSDRPHTLRLQDALAAYLGEQPDAFDDWWAIVGVLFVTPVLATQPSDPVARRYLEQLQQKELAAELRQRARVRRAVEEDEAALEAVAAAVLEAEREAVVLPEQSERLAPTVFPRLADGRLCLLAHQRKGYFKERAEVYELERPARRGGGTAKVTRDDLSRYLWVYHPGSDERNVHTIPLFYVEGDRLVPARESDIELLDRPLPGRDGRPSSILVSEMLPTSPERPLVSFFRLQVQRSSRFSFLTPEAVAKLLRVGRVFGFGQWRTAGFGRFIVPVFRVV